MKKLILTIVATAISYFTMAQSPSKFSYQAVVRSASGMLVANSVVGVRLSIIQGSTNGIVSYAEIHAPNTNANGLFTAEVGGGTPTIGTFATISWANGPYFLKSEIDVTGSTNYDIVSVSQLLSVPYSLHSSSTSSVDWSDVLNKPSMNSNTFSGSYLDLTNKPIITNNTFTGNYADLTNKPTIPASFSGSYLDLTNRPIIVNNTFTGSYTDLMNKPTIPASFSGSYLDLTNKPIIVNNTFTGSYTDLTNKPTIPASFSGSYLDLTNKPIIVNNTFTGSYTDLTNKPTITTFTGGVGISISGTNQIANTSMDKIVNIKGVNVAISGTYPDFIITGPAMQNGTLLGQMLFWDGTKWESVKPGNRNQKLSYCDGIPTWGNCLPQVVTNNITNNRGIAATSGGDILDDGGVPILNRGVCWSTSPNPTISNSTTSDGTGSGSFISNFTGLTTLTTYYLRAFATNSAGTSYGNEVVFTTINSIPYLQLGDSFGGGVVAYFLQTTDVGFDPLIQHGLIVVPNNQIVSKRWWNNSYLISGATGTSIGSGITNTSAIVTAQGAGSYAAQFCADLSLNGYEDWYLPSIDELTQIYINRSALLGFPHADYWSSSETNASDVWLYSFNYGAYVTNKAGITTVCAVRSF